MLQGESSIDINTLLNRNNNKYDKTSITVNKLIIFIILLIIPNIFDTIKKNSRILKLDIFKYIFITFLFGLSICLSLSNQYNFFFKDKKNTNEINLGKVIIVYYIYIYILINYLKDDIFFNKNYIKIIKILLIVPTLICYFINFSSKIKYIIFNIVIFLLHFIIYYYISDKNELLLIIVLLMFIMLIIVPIIEVITNKNINNANKSINYNYLNRNLINSNVYNVFNNLLNYTIINIILFIMYMKLI
jgi:hypothetical protein